MSKKNARAYAFTGWLLIIVALALWNAQLMLFILLYAALVVFGVGLVVATVLSFIGDEDERP